MRKLIILFSFILFFLPIKIISQFENNKNVKAVIEIKKAENMISIDAKATNNDEIVHDLNYLLLTVKQSTTGNLSNNKQAGKFVISPDETKNLSHVTINYSPEDKIKIYLFVRNEKENVLISKDSVFINIDKQSEMSSNKNNISSKNKEVVKEDDFELKGLVVDNTKSKIGRDFFELFYNLYKDAPEQYAFVINVNELPSIGRNGIINIDTSDRNIYSFRVVPSDEYIAAQAQITLRYLNNYYRENNMIQKELKAP